MTPWHWTCHLTHAICRLKINAISSKFTQPHSAYGEVKTGEHSFRISKIKYAKIYNLHWKADQSKLSLTLTHRIKIKAKIQSKKNHKLSSKNMVIKSVKPSSGSREWESLCWEGLVEQPSLDAEMKKWRNERRRECWWWWNKSGGDCSRNTIIRQWMGWVTSNLAWSHN